MADPKYKHKYIKYKTKYKELKIRMNRTGVAEYKWFYNATKLGKDIVVEFPDDTNKSISNAYADYLENNLKYKMRIKFIHDQPPVDYLIDFRDWTIRDLISGNTYKLEKSEVYAGIKISE